MGENGSGEPASEGCCKVGRTARRYGVEDLDERLCDRHADGESLRELERFVNVTVLERALRDASADVLGEVGAIYDSLAGDDASAGERTEARDRLSRAGLDVDALESAFVSYPTVRSHLRECLDVDTERAEPLDPEDGKGTIEWARARSEGVVRRTLDRLRRDDRIAAGELEVSHVVRVTCRDCGVSMPVETFLDEGGCRCDGGSQAGESGDRSDE